MLVHLPAPRVEQFFCKPAADLACWPHTHVHAQAHDRAEPHLAVNFEAHVHQAGRALSDGQPELERSPAHIVSECHNEGLCRAAHRVQHERALVSVPRPALGLFVREEMPALRRLIRWPATERADGSGEGAHAFEVPLVRALLIEAATRSSVERCACIK